MATAAVQDAVDAFLSTARQFSFTIGTGPIDDTRSCQRGGSLRTVGTSSNDPQAGRFTADVRQTHRACIGAGTTGRLRTRDGATAAAPARRHVGRSRPRLAEWTTWTVAPTSAPSVSSGTPRTATQSGSHGR